VHPTPYGYRLLTSTVTTGMRRAGWLGRGDGCDRQGDDTESCARPADEN